MRKTHAGEYRGTFSRKARCNSRASARTAPARAEWEGLECRALLSVTPAGPEFQVNAFTPDNQIFPAVAADADGDFVVAWESNGQDGDGYGVYFQRYSAAGEPLDGPIRAANTTFGQQYGASVGMDDAGNVVVAWASQDQDGSGYGIFARRFDTSGNPLAPEFQVNTYADNNQTDPSVSVDSDGDFLIAWQSYGNDGNQWGVAARRYNAAGVAQGDEFQVNTTTAGVQAFPSAALFDNGDFVIAFHSSPTGAAGTYDVRARNFTGGIFQGDDHQLNTFTAGDQAYPDVAAGPSGSYVVTWRSDGQDGDGAGVYAYVFTNTTQPPLPEFQVNTTTAGDQSFPAVSVEDDGDFLVTWYSENQDAPGGYGIYARQYSAAGVARSGETQINTFTAGNQGFADVAGDGDGNYVIAWDSEDQDGSGYGIFARRATATVPPPDTTPPTVDIEDVTPDPRTTPVDEITIVFSEPVTGFDILDLQFLRDRSGNLLTGAQTLTTTDNQTFVLGNLSPLTQVAGDYVLFLNSETSGIHDSAGNLLSGDATDEFRIDSTIAGRNIFYNNSAFDGRNPAANPADDDAIPPDKQVLLPGGRATYANYSNYTNGVNGIIVDIEGLPTAALTAEDFRFRVGNNNNPNTWSDGPAPAQILVRPGAGANGSDRVEIVFADRAVRNQWLEVTVITTARTGLAESDVFYFGNLQGETGDNPNAAVVNALDLAGTRARQNTAATISSPYDHNHDGRVNALDVAAVRANQNRTILLIQPPADSTGPGPTATSLVTGSVSGSATGGLFSTVAVA